MKRSAAALIVVVAAFLLLSACGSAAETPQRFLGIEGDVKEYRSFKTADPVADDKAMPGDGNFEGIPLTEFIGEGTISGAPKELWILSSGDGFAVKIAWAGAEKAYVIFSDVNGWSIVAPEHPVSVNAQDVDRIIVVSDDSSAGLKIVRADGSRDVVPFGRMLTSPALLSYHLEGKADIGEGADMLSSEVYSRELSVALADVYEPYTNGAFEITTSDGERYLTNGEGRFAVSKQVIDYREATGDIYENITEISLRQR
ncbi:MAG: hypothetical protein LBL54_04500 [Clostridiales Family XIII bacterium]|jgi:hypothetical protein|nr:hypothetical protein [Clostridiales Family XIII bacterium]